MSLALLPYQQAGVEYLRARRRACLFDEMRLGKTAQALMALPDQAAALVVCPKIATRVWQDEARAWRPDLTPVVLAGRGSFRWPRFGEVVILNYDILPDSPGTVHPLVQVIGDEAHYCKAAASLRTKRFRRIADAAVAAGGCVWVLTGTPLLRDPPDLWNVFQAAGLAYETFGSWMAFQDGFGAKPVEIKVRGGRKRQVLVWGKAKPWIARAIADHSLRRTRAEVLPRSVAEKRRQVLRVDCMTPEAVLQADEAMARLGLPLDLEAALEKVLDQKASTAFEAIARTRQAMSVLKVAAAAELLDQYRSEARPVVVFSAHRSPIETLALRKGWKAILGGTTAASRSAAVDAFQSGKLEGLACTIGAAGTGIKLTRAADVIFVDQDWSPALNAQAEDRLCGMDQPMTVTVTILQADHLIDQMLVRVIERKMAISNSAYQT